MREAGKKAGFFLLFVILGGITGGLLGDLIGARIQALSFLKSVYSIGTVNPVILDLKVIKIAFGVNFNANIMSMIGVIVAIILYRKY